MSDQETPPEVEAAETAPTNTPSPTGPDGQPWDPDRAMQTISKLREFETPAKAYERLSSGEDSDTFRKLAETYGFELPDEEEDDTSGWVDPTAQELAALRKEVADQQKWREEIQVERQVEAFQKDLSNLSAEKGISLSERQTKFILAAAVNDPKGLSPASTKAAFNDLVEELEAYEQGLISKHGIKPKASRKPITGEAASLNPDLNTRADIVKFMQQRMSDAED